MNTGEQPSVEAVRPHRIKKGFSLRREKARHYLIVSRSGDVLCGLHLRYGAGGRRESQYHTFSSPEAFQAYRTRKRFSGEIVALLSRRDYLIRVMEIPRVSGQDAGRVLTLEMENALPSEFGLAEVAYRKLYEKEDGLEVYEVYVARAENLSNVLAELERWGATPSEVWPSAVVWRSLLEKYPQVGLLVGRSEASGVVEVAGRSSGGGLSLRAFPISPAARQNSLPEELTECLRSRLRWVPAEHFPLTVGWFGGGVPADCDNARVRFRDFSGEESSWPDPLVALAADLFDEPAALKSLETSSLLPERQRNRKLARQIVRPMSVGIASAVMGLVLLAAATQVAIFRYSRMDENFSRRIEAIRNEGELAGRLIEQLRAVGAARKTAADFYDVLAGLYAATPEGVTYSQVELSDEGQIGLRGQADSVSLPFLLPERLENLPQFRRVSLQSVGQKSKGAASATEMRLECLLVRENS